MSGVISIVGQGYVGLPLAISAANSGWKVHGVEISTEKFDLLNHGISPVEDVSSAEINKLTIQGMYHVHNDFAPVGQSDIVAICVPTPIDEHQAPDLSTLASACSSIANQVKPGTLIINESTSFPGTLRKFIVPIFESSNVRNGLLFATAPERIDPGNKNWKQENTPRLVGGLDANSLQRALSFYQSFCSAVIPVNSPEVAEMAKLLENSFRLINISFINELSLFANKLGVDLREVVEAASTKPYGYMPFYPSAGIGGHCIPVDPYYLLMTMNEENVKSPVLEAAAQSNVNRSNQILELARELSRGVIESLLIVGVAYKSGISDTRESASERIAEKALSAGIKVYWHDRLVDEWKYAKKWEREKVDVAIVAIIQPGDEDVLELLDTPILDCTGALKGRPGVTIL